MANNEELASVNVEIVETDALEQIGILAKIDDSYTGAGILGRIDSALGMASNVLDVAEGASLYKVKVPKGYSLKDLAPSKKDSEAVRALVKDSHGKINGDVSLKLNGISPTQIASLSLAAAAMVVGQAYMTEISDSLDRIDSKLDTVVAMIASEQRAKVKNAISIARTYADLYADYQRKPQEALQAARNEIESHYNDVGEVIDWMTEQLADLEKRTIGAKPTKKEIAPLLEELHSYEDQFTLCLQALSALAMTRMRYDGCTDRIDALTEQRRINLKSRGFLAEHQQLAGVMELKLGSLEAPPIALPQARDSGNILKRMVSQTPRAAAKEQLLKTKRDMQQNLRTATTKTKERAAHCTVGIDRVISASQSVSTLLTDGTNVWIIEDSQERGEIC